MSRGSSSLADLLHVHVHRHEVTGHDRSIDVIQDGVRLAESVDLRVDLIVGHHGRRNRHAQFVAAP